jgi:hypothetical protein
MRLARLGRMSVEELALRGSQEATKWLERIVPREAVATAAPPDLTSFFPGPAEPSAPGLLAKRMPEARDAVLASADSLLAGRFDLLGYRGLSFGDPIDWRLDPVSGTRSPRVHWSRIDPLDPRQVGDSKVVWELGRMQWVVTLGQAWRFTGDPRYALAFAGAVRSFIHENPVGTGIQWASSLECALRILSWSWALALFQGAPEVDAELRAALAAMLAAHARHVERYLSSWSSPNTHLTGEALGLVYAGVLLPGQPRARRWVERGLEILVEQSARQMLSDGVYFEQATCYQRYTAEIGLHALILCRRAGREVPEEFAERLQRLLDALLALRRPDGALPAIGDADGGWLLPLAIRPPQDARGTFAVAAAVFSRADYAWAAQGAAPEIVWMLGSDGLAAFDALLPAPPAHAASRAFPAGGYAVLSSGWDREAHQLVFDAGPLGCPLSGAHGHADLLAIQCSAFGEPYVVDPGTHVYTGSEAWRDFFRGTSAHATVVVDGVGQAEPAGPFAWRSRPRARLQRWLSTDGFDYADASHDAYRQLPEPVLHRRRVLFVKPRFWIVADELLGSGLHDVELRFPFAPMPVEVGPGPWVRAHGTQGRGLLLRCFSETPLDPEIRCGETDPIQGWVASDYGRREPAPVVLYAATLRLPLRLLTLLLPVADVAARPPEARALPGGEAGPAGLVLEWDGGTSDRVLFHDNGFVQN